MTARGASEGNIWVAISEPFRKALFVLPYPTSIAKTFAVDFISLSPERKLSSGGTATFLSVIWQITDSSMGTFERFAESDRYLLVNCQIMEACRWTLEESDSYRVLICQIPCVRVQLYRSAGQVKPSKAHYIYVAFDVGFACTCGYSPFHTPRVLRIDLQV